jgi:rod shape-determining protein MreD
VLIAIAAALVLQTILARYAIGGDTAVDLVLVVVVYVALTGGPVAGLLTGTAGGLAQDVLGAGLVGVSGLAKTVVGFLAGVGGAQFIVAQPLPRLIAFSVATVVHAVCFYGLYALIEPRGFPTIAVLTQAVGNGVIGVAAFQVAKVLPRVAAVGRSRRR